MKKEKRKDEIVNIDNLNNQNKMINEIRSIYETSLLEIPNLPISDWQIELDILLWIMESDLEKALVVHIEEFLLELGNGFMFVGTQQRVTIANEHYYVDMVFYNKILKSYVLIELKTKKINACCCRSIKYVFKLL